MSREHGRALVTQWGIFLVEINFQRQPNLCDRTSLVAFETNTIRLQLLYSLARTEKHVRINFLLSTFYFIYDVERERYESEVKRNFHISEPRSKYRVCSVYYTIKN